LALLRGVMKLPKIPLHILNNFIYRDTWNNIYRKAGNASFLFLGQVGKGKSWAALRFCEDLDKNFSADNIVFSVKDYTALLNSGRLKRGSAVLFDEIAGSEGGADSRSSLTKTNKTLGFIVTTTRVKGLITCYSSPMLSQIDKNIRRIGVTGYVSLSGFSKSKKISFAKYYLNQTHSMASVETHPFYVLRDRDSGKRLQVSKITITAPSSKTVKAYEKKKIDFVDSRLKEWDAKMSEEKGLNKNEKKINDKERLMIVARTLRDVGQTWKQVAKKVKRSPQAVQMWDLDSV